MDADGPLDPARLENLALPTARRGLEPAAVRDALRRAADEIRRLRALVADLETQLAPVRELTVDELEARRVAAALGAEAAQVLEAAQRAAAERTERAEREVDEMLAAAREETERLRAEAGEEAKRLRAEAREEVERLRAEAQGEAERLRAEARDEADLIVEDGRRLGREIVAEAQAVRERMLTDLARRRQSARMQLEQLRAGRDRLLEALVVAQESLDASVAELVAAVPEAQALAERAGLRVAAEPEPGVAEIEAEIESARLVGHPLVEGIEVPDSGPYDLDAPPPPTPTVLAPPDAVEESSEEPEREEPEGEEPEGEEPEGEEPEGEEPEGEEPEGDGPGPEPRDEGGGESGAGEAGAGEEEKADDVDDLFRRLRSSRAVAVAAAHAVLDEPPTPVLAPPDAVGESSQEPEREEPEREEPEREGEDGQVAWWTGLGRALKRAVVDEQADLLDGLRREGVDAVARHLAGDPVERWHPVLADLLTDGADVDAAVAVIVELVEEPLRYRLRAALDEGDDADELTAVLRAAYRDARGRRVGDALGALADVVEPPDTA